MSGKITPTEKKTTKNSDPHQLTFYLTYILTFYLAFYLAHVLPIYLAFFLAFSLASILECVRVQACSTASCAQAIRAKKRTGPLVPTVTKSWCPGVEEDKEEEGRKELHLC